MRLDFTQRFPQDAQAAVSTKRLRMLTLNKLIGVSSFVTVSLFCSLCIPGGQKLLNIAFVSQQIELMNHLKSQENAVKLLLEMLFWPRMSSPQCMLKWSLML